MFLISSIFVLSFPLFLLVYCWIAQKDRKHYFHIFLMSLVSILWISFVLNEKRCKTEECIEWGRESTGFVLALMELSPLFLLFVLIPWFSIILLNMKKG